MSRFMKVATIWSVGPERSLGDFCFLKNWVKWESWQRFISLKTIADGSHVSLWKRTSDDHAWDTSWNLAVMAPKANIWICGTCLWETQLARANVDRCRNPGDQSASAKTANACCLQSLNKMLLSTYSKKLHIALQVVAEMFRRRNQAEFANMFWNAPNIVSTHHKAYWTLYFHVSNRKG